jgi:membrane protease YdiL (CAAX protease family)
MSRRRAQPVRSVSAADGTPIEEAPLWVLTILTGIFWLVAFPAVVGLLAGWGFWRGDKLPAALAALGIAVMLVVGLATRKPWRRPTRNDLVDRRPFFVRFSTWLMVAIFLPNVLFGVIVLTHQGPPLTYQQVLVLGALISAVQGVLAWLDRRKHRRAGLPENGES